MKWRQRLIMANEIINVKEERLKNQINNTIGPLGNKSIRSDGKGPIEI